MQWVIIFQSWVYFMFSSYAHVYVWETMAMFGIPQLTQLEPQGALIDVDQHLACQAGVSRQLLLKFFQGS